MATLVSSKKCDISQQSRSSAHVVSRKTNVVRVHRRSSVKCTATATSNEKLEQIANDPHTAMFCYQCEQTNDTVGCTTIGVCGKTAETAALQDLLKHSLKGLAAWAHHARSETAYDNPEMDTFIANAMFSTLTNVNFDESRFPEFIHECQMYQELLIAHLAEEGVPSLADQEFPAYLSPNPVTWNLAAIDKNDLQAFLDHGHQVGILQKFVHQKANATLTGLQELHVYGLMGVAAYLAHAERVGADVKQLHADLQKQMAFHCTMGAEQVDTVLAACLEVGELNVRVMAALDAAHTSMLGIPTPTEVSRVPVEGKAILVSGHDLDDMHALLEQTAGKGVHVYSHGELLPAHSYPELHKHAHFKGHFGGAWYQQKQEFNKFPGSILMTSNCVLAPWTTYSKNLFTTGAVGVSGVQHVEHKDFSKVVARALELPGFTGEDVARFPALAPLTVGYGHDTVVGVAGSVIDAVKAGKLEHIFLVGGCDGSEPQRAYYTDLAKMLPNETITLTLGCAKFRLLDQEWGTVADTGLPRLMDMGQCNDAYSAVVVAQALVKALDLKDMNELPLSLDISWFEQKAVAVLLSLLHLGVKNIRLGPRLPAFLTPEALQVLVDNFQLKPAGITRKEFSPAEDLKQMMQNK